MQCCVLQWPEEKGFAPTFVVWHAASTLVGVYSGPVMSRQTILELPATALAIVHEPAVLLAAAGTQANPDAT